MPESSTDRFARSISDRCEVAVVGLSVWTLELSAPYELTTEVAAVEQAAADRGWDSYHLFGFSAGATVALAAACANPDAVLSVAVFEPASIGDDDWSPHETQWRSELSRLRELPREERQTVFRRLLMATAECLPPLGAAPLWDEHTDKLEDMLAQTGFTSGDLAALSQPVLSMSGALSNLRFTALTKRLLEVVPRATPAVFDSCSHLAPPHRIAQQELADELSRLWSRT